MEQLWTVRRLVTEQVLTGRSPRARMETVARGDIEPAVSHFNELFPLSRSIMQRCEVNVNVMAAVLTTHQLESRSG
jgi:hypothetical protein